MRYSWGTESYVAEAEADTRDRDTLNPFRDSTTTHSDAGGRKCEQTTASDGQVSETEESFRGVDEKAWRDVRKVYDISDVSPWY